MLAFLPLRQVCNISIHTSRGIRGLFPTGNSATRQRLIFIRIYTEAFRSLLPSHYEFIFINGPATCDAAPGVRDVFPEGPFNCWYTSPTAKKVKAAHEFVLKVLEEIGGADGLMGFSQVS